MTTSEITFFTRRRSKSVHSQRPDFDASCIDTPLQNSESQFCSQLSAFQSMDASNEEVLNIIRSVGSTSRDFSSTPMLNHQESWQSFATYGPRCRRCGTRCGDDVVYYENFAFHQRHFTCKKCNNQLTHPVLVNGDIYCHSCSSLESHSLNLNDQLCSLCHLPSGPDSIVISGRIFCKQHFKCSVCGKELALDSYRTRAGQFFCQDHAPDGIPCGQCGRPVEGSSIVAFEQRYHPQCFNCAMCHENLANKPFAPWKGRPLCPSCFKRLPRSIRSAISKQMLQTL